MSHGEEFQLVFTREKETPGTVRYQEAHEPTEDPKVGALYLKKSAAAKLGNPVKLIVTIMAGNDLK